MQGLTWYSEVEHCVQAVHCGLLCDVHWPFRYSVAEHCDVVVQLAQVGELVDVQLPCK